MDHLLRELDPLFRIAAYGATSRKPAALAAGAIASIAVLTLLIQERVGSQVLSQLPVGTRPLAELAFGVSSFFTALSPLLVLLVFSALLYSITVLLDVNWDFRDLAVLTGISHLPIVGWATLAAALVWLFPPRIGLSEALSGDVDPTSLWQIKSLAALRLGAYVWTLVILAGLLATKMEDRKWRAPMAVALALIVCWGLLWVTQAVLRV